MVSLFFASLLSPPSIESSGNPLLFVAGQLRARYQNTEATRKIRDFGGPLKRPPPLLQRNFTRWGGLCAMQKRNQAPPTLPTPKQRSIQAQVD